MVNLYDFMAQDPTFHYEHGVNTAQILVDKLEAAGFAVEGDDVPRDLSSQVFIADESKSFGAV